MLDSDTGQESRRKTSDVAANIRGPPGRETRERKDGCGLSFDTRERRCGPGQRKEGKMENGWQKKEKKWAKREYSSPKIKSEIKKDFRISDIEIIIIELQ